MMRRQRAKVKRKSNRLINNGSASNGLTNSHSALKKIIKILPVLIAVPLVFYIAVLIKDSAAPGIQAVNHIRVEGELRFLNEAQIMQMVDENIADDYFGVELSRVREALQQQPWIKNVSLRRKWPAELSVIIEEHKPIAFWNSDAYISESGDVFRPDNIDAALNLPQLSGPQGQHESVVKFINVLYKKMASLKYEIKSLSLDDRRAWTLVMVSKDYQNKHYEHQDYDDKKHKNEEKNEQTINVKLGRFDTEKRLQRFIRILPLLASDTEMNINNKNKIKANNKNRNKVIDMRYPNGFAVQMTDDVIAFTSDGQVQAENVMMAATQITTTQMAALQLSEAGSNE